MIDLHIFEFPLSLILALSLVLCIFMSCSHGAGRVMSRTEAVKTLSLEAEQAKLDEKGIVHALRYQKDLEEASSAYKNIDKVMANQSDLTRIVTALEPIAVIKGV